MLATSFKRKSGDAGNKARKAAAKRARWAELTAAAAAASPPAPRLVPQIPQGWVGGGPISAEFKSIDDNGGQEMNTTGSLHCLNACVRGSDIGDRVGRQIMMKSIQLNIHAYAKAGTGVRQVGRALVVYDRQTNGSLPAVTDIITTVSRVTAPRNLNNRKRFKILWDMPICLSSDVTDNDQSQITIQKYRKLRHPVEFNSGNAGTYGDISTGALWLVLYGTEATGTTAATFDYDSRVRFLDQ